MTDPGRTDSNHELPQTETQGGLSGRQFVIHGAILVLLPLASLALLRQILTLWPHSSFWPFGAPLTENAINGWTLGLFVPCLLANFFFARSRHVDHSISVVLLGAWFVFARIFFGS